MDCDDFEKTLKVIVVGNGNVGKTSMTTRYAKGKYTGNYKKTIGVDFMEKSVELRDLGETVNLMIWDTAGQEEFDALTSRYYKGAGAVIYVFSTVDRDSFDDLPKWKRKVEEECGRICQVLVQNKIDLIEDAAMSRAEVEDMADYMNIRLFRSCVQDNVNVKEVFEHLCRQFLKYGSGGSSDDALSAVADITSLSELAGRGSERGGAGASGSGGSNSGHGRHQSSSRGSMHSVRRGRREASDVSDTASERSSPSQQQQRQQRGAAAMRGPSEKPFPPSVPASIAKGRADRRSADSDDGSDDDDNNDRHDRRSGERRRQQRGRQSVDQGIDDSDDDNDARDSRRGRQHQRGQSPRDYDDNTRSDRSRGSGRFKARGTDDVVAGDSASLRHNVVTTASKALSKPRHESRGVNGKQSERTARTQDRSSRSADESGQDRASYSDGDDATAAAATTGRDTAVPAACSSDGVERNDSESRPSASSASTLKLQPSKRRTNGKKRQAVPECVLS